MIFVNQLTEYVFPDQWLLTLKVDIMILLFIAPIIIV